MIEESSH